MEDVWRRIDAWLAANAPGVAATLQAGATDAQLQEAEAALGVALPEDIRASHRIHDGQQFRGGQNSSEDGLTEGGEFLSLVRIVAEWSVWKGLLDSGDLGDNESDPIGPIRSDWWNPRWIPLTYDGSGNHYCLDLDPAPGGQPGQIITMWHDAPDREVLAPSFRAWLTRFADDLEAGEYVLSEKYAGLVRRDDV